MNINGIDIPEKIFSAQQQNELVIFAGAGISTDTPSNLPSFEQLAEQIETLTLCRRKEKEPIDTYLGRVYHEGKNIYDLINKILSDVNSKYNEYHSSLLKLFPNDNIHLVTTNQDPHFATVNRELFSDEIKMYYGPALPLAKNFTGIVYLHGNVNDKLENMIFTDSDFGEAYLVEGWASRFLKDLFSKYTILFIGYSYDDPVMKYFSRGMQYNERRFIFTSRDANTEDHWQRLHITPIYYDNHSQLLECIRKWENMYSLQYTDQKERLKSILNNKSTLTADDKDYIFYLIDKDYGARFFCDLTQDYYWYDFLLNEGKIDFLFNEKQLTNNEMYLAKWVAENFLTDTIEEFLVSLVRNGNNINSFFAWKVVNTFYNLKKEEKVKKLILFTDNHHQLISLILNQPYTINSYLEFLLLELEIPKDTNTALLIFMYLIKPKIKLDKFYGIISDEEYKETTFVKFMLTGELYSLEKAWNEVIKPHINIIAHEIFVTVTDYIKNIYIASNRYRTDKFDTFSHMRSSIDRHEQDQYSEDIYFLIDILRDSIDFYITNDPTMVDSIIDNWSRSNMLMLERLSLYTLQKSNHINANTKINWLIEKNWMYKTGARKEVFDLIKSTNLELSSKVKSKLISEIISYNTDANDQKEYQIFNFLVFLNNAFPEDKRIKSQLKKISKMNPAFIPREYPEFSSFFTINDYSENIILTKNELATEESTKIIERLIKDNEIGEFDRSEILLGLAEAARDDKPDYQKASEIICILGNQNLIDSDIFEAIIKGLEQEPIPLELLKKLLYLIIKNYDLLTDESKKHISYFLLGQIRHNKNVVQSMGLNKIFMIIKRLFSYHLVHAGSIDYPDDLIYPFSTIGSNFMTSIFTLFTIIMDDDKKLESDQAIKLFNFIEYIAFDKSKFSINAKSVIGIDYAFINYHRPNLADKMIPLFDIEIDAKCAEAMWKGFLFRGRYNDGIVKKLFNNFRKIFANISEEDDETIKAFCSKVVGIAFYVDIEESKDNKWILEFIYLSNELVRETFANIVHHELFKLDTKKADELWADWIYKYWDNRNKNIPVKLTQKEIDEMMSWVIHFDIYFDEAVKCITNSQLSFDPHILLELEDENKDHIKKHPNSVAKYFYHLLKDCSTDQSRYNEHCISEFSNKILGCNLDLEIKGKIEQELARLGIKH